MNVHHAKLIRRHTGLTFLELLLGLTITGLIGVGIAGMMSATTYGTANQRDLRSLVVKQKLIQARLSAAIRSAHQILDADDTYVVIWMSDADSDELPSLSELRRIEFNAGLLRSYRAPADLAPGDDTSYTLATNFDAVTDAIKGTTNFPGETWADQLTAMEFAFNEPVIQDATLVSYRVTITQGTLTEESIGAAALR